MSIDADDGGLFGGAAGSDGAAREPRQSRIPGRSAKTPRQASTHGPGHHLQDLAVNQGLGQRAPGKAQFAARIVDMPQDVVRAAMADHLLATVAGDLFGALVPVADAPLPVDEIDAATRFPSTSLK